ncbi:hypothetical protein EVAR_80669_1 [Eumeta japonica]|uniref:Uncharacterized protein n=1 Tax=Eumeta variegata TaxID=151549 RepID=A0A4C1U3F0_EUMVA|nr:hypothetical protein EVAR_80669_1 [Eumeta japonica]
MASRADPLKSPAAPCFFKRGRDNVVNHIKPRAQCMQSLSRLDGRPVHRSERAIVESVSLEEFTRGVMHTDSERICKAKKTYQFQHCFGYTKYKDTYRRVGGPPTETMLKLTSLRPDVCSLLKGRKRPATSYESSYELQVQDLQNRVDI